MQSNLGHHLAVRFRSSGGCLLLLEHAHHVGHGRPELWAVAHALHGELRHGGGLRGVVLGAKPLVHHVRNFTAADLWPHRGREPVPGLAADGLLPRQELEQQHAKAVHVALLGGHAGAEEVGVDVARGAHDGARRGASAAAHRGRDTDVREPEVAELGVEVGIEEHVGGLDVPVDDGLVAALVEVAVGRVLEHQHALVALVAVAEEADDVRVAEREEHLELPAERAVQALAAAADLDGAEPRGGERGEVHRAEPAAADHAGREPARGGLHLGPRQLPRRAAALLLRLHWLGRRNSRARPAHLPALPEVATAPAGEREETATTEHCEIGSARVSYLLREEQVLCSFNRLASLVAGE
uniref:Uncharacterized protein n=1 Tax=Setaria italica TaxID=4555 RepID=K3Y8C1_SETIT